MRARQSARNEVLAFKAALLVGLLLSRCTSHSAGIPPSSCHRGDPGCSCTTVSNGTTTCVQGVCLPAQVCGSSCCDAGQHCDKNACVTDAAQCLFVPGPNDFEAPEVAWWWPYTDATGAARRSIDLPAFDQVMSTPVVVRIRGAAHPEDPPTVVFNTFHDGGSPNVEGVLRAVKGDDGSPIFSVTDPALRINGFSSIAVGDLDGDGASEIVTGAFDVRPNSDTGGVIAFRADGSLYWKAPDLFVGWGGVSIADLDGDGKPEVVVGNTVLDGTTGQKLCDGGYAGIGDNGEGPLSVVADIDGDGKPEILTGDMAYKFSRDAAGNAHCDHAWPDVIKTSAGAVLLQGFPAVADIFSDPKIRQTINAPEVAVVSGGTLRVQDWTGGIVMNPVKLPGGGAGGPPTIADFDGDGQAEIGVAGQSSYTVFKPGKAGNILWTVKTQDVSSSVTGSSVFDFDGNGVAEVIYNDECYMHVFNGTNGTVEFEAPNSSCTAYEMPVIADVDGTGSASLLAPSNNICNIECPYGNHHDKGVHGLRLFRSPSDSWVASRPVWNQHSYHLTNIGDYGEVPKQEARFWGPNTLNSFRQNYQGQGKFAAPDLTVTKVRLDGTHCPSSLTMVADIANIGSRGIRAGLNVAFYEDTPTGKNLLGVGVLNQPLQPGDHGEVSLEWKGPPRVNAAKVSAVADDDGTGKSAHHECNKNNNTMVFPEVICRDAG
jgi:hypothetical protein